MQKKNLFVFGLLLVGFFFSFVLAEEPNIIYDDLNRTIMIDYTDNSQDIEYAYYGNTSNVQNVYVGNNLERYEFDKYGNLIGEYYDSYPNRDRRYFYDYTRSDMPLLKIFRSPDVIEFKYYGDGNLKSESVIVDGKKFTTHYDYDSRGNLIVITNLNSKTTYGYDDQDRLVSEQTIVKVGGNEYQEISEVNYEYDSNDNLIKMVDGTTGVIVDYSYQDIEYPCYDYSEGAEDSQESCEYHQLIGKRINNYEVNLTVNLTDSEVESYSGNTWSEDYTPLYDYNDEGYLIQEDNFHYNYSEDFSRLDQAKFIYNDSESEINIHFQYNSEGLINQTNYLSDFGNHESNLGYDLLDRVVYERLKFDQSSDILTGSVIKNFFTGFTLSDPVESYTLYYASAGDPDSIISLEEYSELIKPENIWSELSNEYKGADKSDWLERMCTDSDFDEDSVFVYGAVDFGLTERLYDYCLDNQTLVENYCGEGLFQGIDFWVKRAVPKTFNQVCEFGCNMGRCLTAEEIERDIEEFDLPDEPPVLGNI